MGRPRTNAAPRIEQLRLAKRAQRARERDAGLVTVPLKLSARDAQRLRALMACPDFAHRLDRFLEEELVEIAAYENLSMLCWNRRGTFIPAEEAFRLYERNWRLVDTRHLLPAERDLIDRLKARHGNGVMNA